MTKYFIEKMCFYVLFLFPFSYRWTLRGVFIEYSRDIHMYRLCIGYVSVMCRLCIGKASEHTQRKWVIRSRTILLLERRKNRSNEVR